MKRFEGFIDNFGMFFDGNDLQDRFNHKVETRDFNNLKNEMALKSDIMTSRKMVSHLNQRLQQLSILMSEIANSLLPTNN